MRKIQPRPHNGTLTLSSFILSHIRPRHHSTSLYFHRTNTQHFSTSISLIFNLPRPHPLSVLRWSFNLIQPQPHPSLNSQLNLKLDLTQPQLYLTSTSFIPNLTHDGTSTPNSLKINLSQFRTHYGTSISIYFDLTFLGLGQKRLMNFELYLWP